MAERESSLSSPESADDEEYTWLPLSSIPDAGLTVSISQYNLEDLIGEGTYGDVWRAKSSSEGVVAVKVLRWENAGSAAALAPQIRRELQIMRWLKHRNIVSLRDVAVDDRAKELDEQTVYFVMDFVPYNLASLIGEAEEPFGLGEVKCLFRQLLRGVEYLHANRIIHRDLKTENILVTASGTLKIADFNTARYLPSKKIGTMTPNVTTEWFAAPELLFGSSHYSSAVDIFSAGCILAEMLTLEPLIQGDDAAHQLNLMAKVLGAPSDDEQRALEHCRCPALEHWLTSRSKLPETLGSLEAKVRSWGPETANMLRALMRWAPAARYTAAEALGGGAGGDHAQAARAWWKTPPHAVKRWQLSFVDRASGASDHDDDEESDEADGRSSPPAKRSTIS